MELPDKYKNLYKHWQSHTINRYENSSSIFSNSAVLKDIEYFVNERLSVFEKKENNQARPYTADPILAKYRFCNIYRELDKQTVFYHEYLKHLESDFELWLLNILFCRSICNIDTVQELGVLSFDNSKNDILYEKLLKLHSPKYGNAYIFPISVIQKSEWNTREKFFCFYYPLVIKKVASAIQSSGKESVVNILERILPIFGFNLKFLWTEVLIDVAYQFPEFTDLYKRFPIGPGSMPTMLKINSKENPEITNQKLIGCLDSKLDLPTINGGKVFLSAENWEGIGCEFRKYSNLKSGNGRKRIYK